MHSSVQACTFKTIFKAKNAKRKTLKRYKATTHDMENELWSRIKTRTSYFCRRLYSQRFFARTVQSFYSSDSIQLRYPCPQAPAFQWPSDPRRDKTDRSNDVSSPLRRSDLWRPRCPPHARHLRAPAWSLTASWTPTDHTTTSTPPQTRGQPDISPTGHFPAKPKPDNSPTDQIAQADKSPTGNYPVKR